MANGQAVEIRSDRPSVARGSELGRRLGNSAATGRQLPNASFAANFGRVPWWAIPASVLHIHGTLPKPVSVWQSREFQCRLVSRAAWFSWLFAFIF